MKKITFWTALLAVCLMWSCEKQETSPETTTKIIVVNKTSKMRDFEKSIADYGRINDSGLREKAFINLITTARQYLQDNGEIVLTNTDDAQILNAAIDVHMKKINELRTKKQ